MGKDETTKKLYGSRFGCELGITAAACIVVADFVTTKFQLKNKYNAKRKYD